jgi:hypothetical protein
MHLQENWEASEVEVEVLQSVKLKTIKLNRLRIKNSFKERFSSSYPNSSNLEVTWLTCLLEI